MQKISVFPWTIVLTAAALAGCATTPPSRPLGGITAVEGSTTANLKDFTPERRSKFQAALEKKLYGPGSGFVRGNDYRLTWTPVKVDEGSRALRYFVGFGAGAGTMVTNVKVTDAKGKLVGQGEAEGKRVMGIAGGDFEGACEEAGEEIAKVARTIVSGHK